MRRQLMILVLATTSLVLVAFLVPLALLVKNIAANRAVNDATHDAEALAPLAGTMDRDGLTRVLDRLDDDPSVKYELTVYLPDGAVLGAQESPSPAVKKARGGRSLTADIHGGREILVATWGHGGTSVIRAYVSAEQLHHGVARTWLVLGLLGLVLLGLSTLVADRLGRTIVKPTDRLVAAVHRLADGELDARVDPAGPPEIRQVGAGVNLLATRIRELLDAERAEVADLSHQLRTPLTALRLSVESLSHERDRERITHAMAALERSVDRVIREARRRGREVVRARCDATRIAGERLAYWAPLAEDEGREVIADLPEGTGTSLWINTTEEDLAAAVDALLGNVFVHTPPGTAFGLTLSAIPGGGAKLVVYDYGASSSGAPGADDTSTPDDHFAQPELPDADTGSTGLGLDIVRRTAETSGGSTQVEHGPQGMRVTVRFGPATSLD